MSAEPTTTKRVLIVDDEPLMRQSIVRLLGTRFQVHDVGDDVEALDALEHHTFDLAIIDVVLPGISGPELAGRLRQTLPGMTVVFISGYDKNMLEDRGVDPADHFLRKPFTRDALLESMQKALEADRAR